jgi:catechol-2,3-dioxygenase
MSTSVRLGHVALAAQDPVRLAAFYTDFLGLAQTGRIDTPEAGAMVFLSSRPEETEQELALVSQPQARHVAFQVASLPELQALYEQARAQQIPVLMSFDHGSQLSFYFLDPEGNPCEAFWETGRAPLPIPHPIDLSLPLEELRAQLSA